MPTDKYRHKQRRCCVCHKPIPENHMYWYEVTDLGDDFRWHSWCNDAKKNAA